jgi:hypothetical protein
MPGDSYSDIDIYSEAAPPQRHRLLTLLAEFLDDEHSHLRLCCRPSSLSADDSGKMMLATTPPSQNQIFDEIVDTMVI